MQIAPFIVMYVGFCLLFSAVVLVLALEFFKRVDRDRVDGTVIAECAR